MHILLPQGIDITAKKIVPEVRLYILLLLQLVIDPPHRSLAVLVLDPVEEVRRLLVPLVPSLGQPVTLPVDSAEAGPQPHPVRDALDQPAGTRAVAVVLEAVDQLVDEDACNLVGARDITDSTLGGLLYAFNIAEREV